jgi:hypothetical protein
MPTKTYRYHAVDASGFKIARVNLPLDEARRHVSNLIVSGYAVTVWEYHPTLEDILAPLDLNEFLGLGGDIISGDEDYIFDPTGDRRDYVEDDSMRTASDGGDR